MLNRIKNIFSLQRLHEEFIAILKRFPLSVLMAVALFFYISFEIHGASFFEDDISAKIILSGLMGFYWFLSVKLYRENHDISGNLLTAITVIGGLAIVATNVAYDVENHELQPIILTLAVFLMVFVAPFIGKTPDDFSFWAFCKTVVLGIGLGLLAAIIFFLGSLAIIMSIQFLFDIKFDEKLMLNIWIFCSLLLGPLYSLSFIPKNFVTREQECSLPPQIGFIANWILAPLAAIYILVLYAYFIKIGVTWTLPKGEIIYIVGGFALTGIITYLVAWAFDATGRSSRVLSFIMRHFFKLMIIPVAFMAWAIAIRINEYGVTQDRYFVVAGLLWFVFLTAGFLLHKLSLKHVVLSLVASLIIISIGPWNINNVSLWSQKGRLENLLQKHNLLEGDDLIKAENGQEIEIKDRAQISSIVDFLTRRRWGEEEYLKKVLYGAKDRNEFFEQVGFDYTSMPRSIYNKESDRFYYHFNNNRAAEAIDVRGYDFIMHYAGFNQRENFDIENIKDRQLRGYIDGNVLKVYFPPYGEGTFDLTASVEKLRANEPYVEQKPGLKITVKGAAFTADIIINSINGDAKDDTLTVQHLSGYALIKIR